MKKFCSSGWMKTFLWGVISYIKSSKNIQWYLLCWHLRKLASYTTSLQPQTGASLAYLMYRYDCFTSTLPQIQPSDFRIVALKWYLYRIFLVQGCFPAIGLQWSILEVVANFVRFVIYHADVCKCESSAEIT